MFSVRGDILTSLDALPPALPEPRRLGLLEQPYGRVDPENVHLRCAFSLGAADGRLPCEDSEETSASWSSSRSRRGLGHAPGK